MPRRRSKPTSRKLSSGIQLPRPRRGRRLPPGIVRLDYEKAKGYNVRIGYIRKGDSWRPRFRAYFADGRYGGKAEALAAARKWLRTLIRTGKAPKRPTDR